MMYKVFVNGGEGTTGLRIVDRLNERTDIELLHIPTESRKDNKVVREYINASDVTFLCLPDEAARAAVNMVENDRVKIIDASTAHRVNPGWIYGFPELSAGQYERIRTSKRVAVPGCYAGAFIALIHPLIRAGIIPEDFPLTATGISGYSGAGKKAIAEYEAPTRDTALDSPRLYALSQSHKHLPEMQHYCSLLYPPIFVPVIDSYYSGMIVTVPLYALALKQRCTRGDICEVWRGHYGSAGNVVVRGTDDAERTTFLAANELAGSDKLELNVFGNDERMVLAARLDNLGKGASGAALQCMDIMMSGT